MVQSLESIQVIGTEHQKVSIVVVIVSEDYVKGPREAFSFFLFMLWMIECCHFINEMETR